MRAGEDRRRSRHTSRRRFSSTRSTSSPLMRPTRFSEANGPSLTPPSRVEKATSYGPGGRQRIMRAAASRPRRAATCARSGPGRRLRRRADARARRRAPGRAASRARSSRWPSTASRSSRCGLSSSRRSVSWKRSSRSSSSWVVSFGLSRLPWRSARLCGDEIESQLVPVAVEELSCLGGVVRGRDAEHVREHDCADALPQRGRIAQPVEDARCDVGTADSSWPRFPSFGFA